MKRRWLILICLLLFAAGCGAETQGGCGKVFPSRNHSVASGSPAPDFSLPLVSESPQQTVTLSEWIPSGPVLLVFWASWCPTCVTEVPILNEWHEKYAREGLRIIAVNVQESEKKVREFIETHPVDYPVAMDIEGEVTRRYGIIGVPVSVLIRSDGKIIYFGYSLPQNMDPLIGN